MNEHAPTNQEQKLWHDGPNYTADAVIFDHDVDNVLLIQRGDTGDWALPGGFIDTADTSALESAIREAKEEAGVALEGGVLLYEGKVEDPRNTTVSWIETSAYLFYLPNTTEAHADDDALNTWWCTLASLPPLYGSHLSIIERALQKVRD